MTLTGWNTRVENLLIMWAKQMNVNRLKHEKQAKKYAKLRIAFGLPNILTTTLASFLLMGSLKISTNGYFGMILIIIISTIVFTSALLTAIQTFFNFGQRSEKHRQTALQLISISGKIDSNLLLYRPNRPDVKTFLQNIQDEFNNVVRYGPPLMSSSIENDLPNFTLATQILNDPSLNSSINIDDNYLHTYDNIQQYNNSVEIVNPSDSSDSSDSSTNFNNSNNSFESIDMIDPDLVEIEINNEKDYIDISNDEISPLIKFSLIDINNQINNCKKNNNKSDYQKQILKKYNSINNITF